MESKTQGSRSVPEDPARINSATPPDRSAVRVYRDDEMPAEADIGPGNRFTFVSDESVYVEREIARILIRNGINPHNVPVLDSAPDVITPDGYLAVTGRITDEWTIETMRQPWDGVPAADVKRILELAALQ